MSAKQVNTESMSMTHQQGIWPNNLEEKELCNCLNELVQEAVRDGYVTANFLRYRLNARRLAKLDWEPVTQVEWALYYQDKQVLGVGISSVITMHQQRGV